MCRAGSGTVSVPSGHRKPRQYGQGFGDDSKEFGHDLGSTREPGQGLAREWCAMISFADIPQGSHLDNALEKPSGRVGEAGWETLAAVQVAQ